MQRHGHDTIGFHGIEARAAVLTPQFPDQLRQTLARVMLEAQHGLTPQVAVGAKADGRLEGEGFVPAVGTTTAGIGERTDGPSAARACRQRVTKEASAAA
jgi:hypothetical protein